MKKNIFLKIQKLITTKNFTKAITTVPGAPTGLTAGTITSNSIALSWTAPSSNGGSSITDYLVSFTPSVGSASTSYTLFELNPGTTYTITVSAVNGVGTGYASSSITETTFGKFIYIF